MRLAARSNTPWALARACTSSRLFGPSSRRVHPSLRWLSREGEFMGIHRPQGGLVGSYAMSARRPFQASGNKVPTQGGNSRPRELACRSKECSHPRSCSSSAKIGHETGLVRHQPFGGRGILQHKSWLTLAQTDSSQPCAYTSCHRRFDCRGTPETRLEGSVPVRLLGGQ